MVFLSFWIAKTLALWYFALFFASKYKYELQKKKKEQQKKNAGTSLAF